MDTYELTHLSDPALLRGLADLTGQDRTTTASLLAHLAEVDARKLYLPAASPSMFHYCVRELFLSEDEAYKRVRAARAGRVYPAIFVALAEGRLHLSAVVLLAPHLTPKNANELLSASMGKTRLEIQQLLAERGCCALKPEPPSRVRALPPSLALPTEAAVPEQEDVEAVLESESPEQSEGLVVSKPPAEPKAPAAKVVKPVLVQRFILQATIGESTHEMLRHAQALLGHQVPSGDLEQVLDLAFKALVEKLEKQK